MGVIWGKREGECFWGRGWTGEIRLIWFRKLVFWRSGPVVENAASSPHERERYAGNDSEGAKCRRVHPDNVRCCFKPPRAARGPGLPVASA
jgi:hypothetical protein